MPCCLLPNAVAFSPCLVVCCPCICLAAIIAFGVFLAAGGWQPIAMGLGSVGLGVVSFAVGFCFVLILILAAIGGAVYFI